MNRVHTYIYEKKHKSGNVSFIVRYKDFDTGKWVSFSAGDSKNEALLYEAKIRQQLFAGVNPQAALKRKLAEAAISEIVEAYYKHPRFMGLSADSQDNTKSFFRRFIIPQWGKMKITALKDEHFFNLYSELRKKKLTNSTIRRFHHTLGGMFSSYCETHPDVKNPMAKLPKLSKIAPRQASSRDINFLVPEELNLLLQHTKEAQSKLLHNVVQFLAFTGMRRSEALNLKWTDVDRESGFFHIRKSKTQRARSIPIEKEALDAILPLEGNGIFVFSRKGGARPDPDSFLRPLKVALKNAGFTKRVDLHTLRHSFGSNKLRSGWGLKKVSKLLGHANIQMTAEVYAHILDGDLKVADQHAFEFSQRNDELSKEEMLKTLIRAMRSLGPISVEELAALASEAPRTKEMADTTPSLSEDKKTVKRRLA